MAYPLLITGVSQVAFPGDANGQKVYVHGRLVGSKIIGQSFAKVVLAGNGKPREENGEVVTEPDRRYFQSRPSVTEGGAYNAAGSTFSNRGPNDKATEEADAANIKAYLELERPYDPGLTTAEIPVDAVNTLGLQPRPGSLAGQRAHPGAPRRHDPPPAPRCGGRADLQVHRRPRSRLLRRSRA